MLKECTMTVDDYEALSDEDKLVLLDWIAAHVDATKCFEFRYAEGDYPIVRNAQFRMHDLDKFKPGMAGIPNHTVDLLGVEPCPFARPVL